MFKLDNSTGGTYVDRLPPDCLGTYGACKGHPDQSVFFGDDSPAAEDRKGLRSSKKTRQARLICAKCPVRTVCLSYSLEATEPYGVWACLDRFDRARVLSVRPSHLGGLMTGRALRDFRVSCDTRGCDQDVPLAQAHRWLTKEGVRLCATCRALT